MTTKLFSDLTKNWSGERKQRVKKQTNLLLILEYMGLDPNDYYECEDNKWYYSHAKDLLDDLSISVKMCCGKPFPPDYENSLDAQQPVIEKLAGIDWKYTLETYLDEGGFIWRASFTNDYSDICESCGHCEIDYLEAEDQLPAKASYKAIIKILEEL